MGTQPPARVRREVNLDELDERLRVEVRSKLAAEVMNLAPLDGGRSSLTYRAELVTTEGPQQVVVRVAPPGLEPVGNRDVLRQARLLIALGAAGTVPVPTVRLHDEGAPPDVPPLYLMDFVLGESIEPIFSASGRLPDFDTVRARALAAARTLAALHRVAVERVSAGEDVITLEDELDRWTRTLIAAGAAEAAEPARARLAATMPGGAPPAIVHGDFRLGNLLFVEDELQAVLDWEIWALTDPRIDLAWLLLTAMPDVHPGSDREPTGMPAPAELIAEYEKHVDRAGATKDVSWFIALALYKMAAMSRHIGKKFPVDDPRRTGREAAAERMLAESLAAL